MQEKHPVPTRSAHSCAPVPTPSSGVGTRDAARAGQPDTLRTHRLSGLPTGLEPVMPTSGKVLGRGPCQLHLGSRQLGEAQAPGRLRLDREAHLRGHEVGGTGSHRRIPRRAPSSPTGRTSLRSPRGFDPPARGGRGWSIASNGRPAGSQAARSRRRGSARDAAPRRRDGDGDDRPSAG